MTLTQRRYCTALYKLTILNRKNFFREELKTFNRLVRRSPFSNENDFIFAVKKDHFSVPISKTVDFFCFKN